MTDTMPSKSDIIDIRNEATTAPTFELTDIRNEATVGPACGPGDDRLEDTVPPSLDHYALDMQEASSPALRGGAGAPAPMPTEPRASAADGQPHPGLTLGKYQLIRELGRGGMGVVFLARDTQLGRLVAIKFLTGQSQKLSESFIAEARTTAQCNHDNIVVLHEASEHNGMPYMVLEYLEGTPLNKLLDSQPFLSVQRSLEIVVQVLQALERAHSMGIVHRDLKPANVMLTDTGAVKVLDFGIAKVLPGAGIRAATMDSEGGGQGIVGTLPYMSPEQLAGRHVDARTDIWSVGVMFYEMLTGTHPLAPLTLRKLEWVSDLAVPMPRVSEKRPDLGKLGPIIDRCLLKPLNDRIGSARELLDELTPLLARRRGPELSEDHNPFAGLSAFQEADAQRFYGRERDIANLVTQVRHQPLVSVIGPSGVGKSSLIRAGVIPALKCSGEGWESIIIRPGRSPLDSLVDVLDHLRFRDSTGVVTGMAPTADAAAKLPGARTEEDRATLIQKLSAAPGYLSAQLRAWAERKLRRIVLFVDQFEEIYTAHPGEAERAAFLACLASIADDASSPLRVILTMRSDFLGTMATDREFMAATTRCLVFLAPLKRDGLRAALVNPVESVGYRFESPAMLDEMLDELANAAGPLPLLQFAASQLWRARDTEQRMLTDDSYRAMGGIAGTLARHADQVLARMTAQQVKLARAIFERLVTPERTRALVSTDDIRALSDEPVAIERVLHALADARLVVIEASEVGDAGAAGAERDSLVEIVHESLITGWPTLSRWLSEGEDNAEFLAQLRSAAKAWREQGKAEGLLWRGEIAREAQRWHERFDGELPERETQFLRAVLDRVQRSARRRRRFLSVVMLALIAVASSSSVTTFMVMQKERATAVALDKVESVLEETENTLLEHADNATVAAQAREAIMRGLHDEEPAVRVSAIRAVREVRDRHFIARLTDLTESDPDVDVRGQAALTLAEIQVYSQGSRGVEELLEKLDREAGRVLRVWYAHGLARMGQASARAELIDMAGSSDLAVALPAARALADVSKPGDQAALEALRQLRVRDTGLTEVDDVALHARIDVLTELARLGDEAASAELHRLLREPDDSIRLMAAASLAGLGDPAGETTIEAVFRDEASPDRIEAARLLAQKRDYAGHELLRQGLGGEFPRVRRVSASGLGDIGDSEDLRRLHQALRRDEDPSVRIAAATAALSIVKLDPSALAQASVNWSKHALASQNWVAREAAAHMLGDLPSTEALPLLAQALADTRAEVRLAATTSAARMHGAATAMVVAAAVAAEVDPTIKEAQVVALSRFDNRVSERALRHVADANLGDRVGVLALGSLMAIEGDAADDRERLQQLRAAYQSPEQTVRLAVMEAAILSNNQNVTPLLERGLSDSYFPVQFTAAEGMAHFLIKHNRAISLLEYGLTLSPYQGRALASLVRLDVAPAQQMSPEEMLDSPDVKVRRTAVAAIVEMNWSKARPLLRRASTDTSTDIKRAALDAIAGFIDRDRAGVVALYRTLVDDADPIIRTRAKAQLSRLTAVEPSAETPESAELFPATPVEQVPAAAAEQVPAALVEQVPAAPVQNTPDPAQEVVTGGEPPTNEEQSAALAPEKKAPKKVEKKALKKKKENQVPVTFRRYKGPADLTEVVKLNIKARYAQVDEFKYRATGRKFVIVDTVITVRSRPADEKTVDHVVEVKHLVLRQPGNTVLGSIKARRTGTLDATAAEQFVTKLTQELASEASDSAFRDLVTFFDEHD